MRHFNLPASLSNDLPQLPQATVPRTAPAVPPEHPPSAVPKTGKAPPHGWKALLAALSRLRASFAHAEAVHQARLDACWSGPERHLMAHYTRSVK